MPGPGYSDRINHALAFAAKHHDRQVHKGARTPFVMRAANVAVILSRYDCDDATVVAGILQDVVSDWVDDRYTAEILSERIGEKFGQDVLASILAVTPRRADGSGVELTNDERREDMLDRLASANEQARWVCAAVALHAVGATLANLRRTIDVDSVWSQEPLGRAGSIAWYRALCERFAVIGFSAPIVAELSAAVHQLD